jgi:hypothetical protein
MTLENWPQSTQDMDQRDRKQSKTEGAFEEGRHVRCQGTAGGRPARVSQEDPQSGSCHD